MLDEMSKAYVTTARAKGLGERVVIVSHTLKNAAIPILTMMGDEAASLLNGAVVIETLFGWPGVGILLIQAIENRDLPLIEATVIVIAIMIVTVNLLVDLTYSLIDPRVRYAVTRSGRRRSSPAPAGARSRGARVCGRGRARVEIYLRALAARQAGACGGDLPAVLIFAAVFAGLVAPHDPGGGRPDAAQQAADDRGRGRRFPLRPRARTRSGRDQLSRLLYGARVSLVGRVRQRPLSGTFGVLLGLPPATTGASSTT